MELAACLTSLLATRVEDAVLRGIRTRYHIGGDPPEEGEEQTRPTVLLLHGNGGSMHRWSLCLAEWIRSDCLVYAPDLPGFGEASELRGPLSLERYGVFVGDFISRIIPAEAGSRISIVGHGFGALIAAWFAVRFPRCVESLVLCNAVGAHPRDGLLRRLVRKPWVSRRISRLLRSPTFFPLLAARAFYRPTHIPSWVLESVRHDYLRARVFIDLFQQLSAENVSCYDRLQVPTQVIWGRQDRLLPPRLGRRLQRRIPESDWTCLDRCGHFPMMDRPQEFVEAAAGFIQRIHRARREEPI